VFQTASFSIHVNICRFQVLASSAAVRRQLYELEHGVCQMCKVDAALQYRTVKSLTAGEERLCYLMNTQHRLRGRLDKMLIDPKEGDFWQVTRLRFVRCNSHSLTTIAGRSHSTCQRRRCDGSGRSPAPRVTLHAGGQASISNFRTLCTPCHEAETRALMSRLAAAESSRAAQGSKDIRAFFK
jgi:hypothetical protein